MLCVNGYNTRCILATNFRIYRIYLVVNIAKSSIKYDKNMKHPVHI